MANPKAEDFKDDNEFSEEVLLKRLKIALDQVEPTSLDNVTDCDDDKSTLLGHHRARLLRSTPSEPTVTDETRSVGVTVLKAGAVYRLKLIIVNNHCHCQSEV